MRWSALHFACRYGHVAVVQLLIKRGANPDLPDEVKCSYQAYWDLLCFCSCCLTERLVPFVCRCQNGNTPLHLTAGWGNLRCCVLMLEAGANVSATNHSNQTPLSVATKLARKDHIQLLDRWRPTALGIKGLSPDWMACATAFSRFPCTWYMHLL